MFSLTVRWKSDADQTETQLSLDFLRPHLVQTFQNASAVTQMQAQLAAHNQVLEDSHQALVSINLEGRIRFISPSAQVLLQQYGLQLHGNFHPPTLLKKVLAMKHDKRHLQV